MELVSKTIILILFSMILTNCSNDHFQDLTMTENKYIIASEEQLKSIEHQKVISDLYDLGSDGYFKGEKGINIYYKNFMQSEIENDAILISNGRRENVLKYKEVIYDLYRNGYSVYIIDHRGQGFSERINNADKQMGHIDDFEYYVYDLKKYYDKFVKINYHKKIFLLAHSMGAAIGTRYIEKFPNDFDAAAFSSPMYGLKFPACELIGLLTGDKHKYLFGEKNYDDEENSFLENNLTHSKLRYEAMMNMYENNPSTKIGGPSYQWVYQSCKTFKKIFKNLINIKIPIILMQAGEDKVVTANAQKKFVFEMKKLGKNVQGLLISGAYHEILNEEDKYRTPLMKNILDYFANARTAKE